MNVERLLREYINEVAVDFRGRLSSEESENFLVKPSGEPWKKLLPSGLVCFSVYRANKEAEIDTKQVIRAVKNPASKGGVKVPRGVVDEILQRGLEICLPWIKSLDFNVVTTPQSSKTLAVRFGSLIAERSGVDFVPAGTLKDLENAKISEELPSSFTEKSAKMLQMSLERMKSSEEQNLQKHFRPQDRKFISSWQKMREKSGLSSGDRVLLVDDVLSDGSTLTEMQKTLLASGIEAVGCLTLFKTR